MLKKDLGQVHCTKWYYYLHHKWTKKLFNDDYL
jgi:hypothetical protein